MGNDSLQPSRWSRRIAICVVAFIGSAIGFYMALYQLGYIDTVWDPVFGSANTEKVLTSKVSVFIRKWMLIPDALLGSLAYFGDIVFALLGSRQRWIASPWLVVIFGINVVPVGFVSLILVALQATVVKSWCFLCLITASVSVILIFLAYEEISASIMHLWRVWKSTKNPSLLWKAFLGKQ